LRTPIILMILGCHLVLSGCNGTPHSRDLETLYLVYRGRATHKQAFIWFERTTYEGLVRSEDYVVRWFPGDVRERKRAPEGESVRDVIAAVTGSVGEPRHFYFLVRGIGKNEEVFRGYDTDSHAANLTIVAGDLLVIDPPPTHVLFGAPKAQLHSHLIPTG
jgi:hypothetical protein